jgi:hypothetical protein
MFYATYQSEHFRLTLYPDQSLKMVQISLLGLAALCALVPSAFASPAGLKWERTFPMPNHAIEARAFATGTGYPVPTGTANYLPNIKGKREAAPAPAPLPTGGLLRWRD